MESPRTFKGQADWTDCGIDGALVRLDVHGKSSDIHRTSRLDGLWD